MPQAGWCRECGEWVWLDGTGACQNGHGTECIDGAHDVTPAPARLMGDGEAPEELDVFNWGAYLLPVLWGAAYGVWPLIGAWGLALLVTVLISGMVPLVNEVPEVRPFIMATIGSSIVASAVRIWAGYRANRLAWNRNVRVAALSETLAAKRPAIDRFLGRQRWWAIVGWILVLGSTGIVLPFVYQTWEAYGLGLVGMAREVVWLLAEVGAASWLAFKMRHGGLAGPSDDREQS